MRLRVSFSVSMSTVAALMTGLAWCTKFLSPGMSPWLTEKVIYINYDKGDVPVELALQYNTSFSENVHSYVNNINTIE